MTMSHQSQTAAAAAARQRVTHSHTSINTHTSANFIEHDSLGDSSDDEDIHTPVWVRRYCNSKGNEYLCQVDEEFINDRFNLTGIGTEVEHASAGYDRILHDYDPEEDDVHGDGQGEEDGEHITTNGNEQERKHKISSLQAEMSARQMYTLIHARFIITPIGLTRMKKKLMSCAFGLCPRVLCHGQYLIPVGLSDLLNRHTVKLFCASCEDIYNPKSSAHNAIDGACFGTTFPHLFFQTFPRLRLLRNAPDGDDQDGMEGGMDTGSLEADRNVYVPKIFGFRIAGPETLERLGLATILPQRSINGNGHNEDINNRIALSRTSNSIGGGGGGGRSHQQRNSINKII